MQDGTVDGKSVTVERVVDTVVRLAELVVPVVVHLQAVETCTGRPATTASDQLWDAMVQVLQALRLDPNLLKPPRMSAEEARLILGQSGATTKYEMDAAESRAANATWTAKMSHAQEDASDTPTRPRSLSIGGVASKRVRPGVITADDEEMEVQE